MSDITEKMRRAFIDESLATVVEAQHAPTAPRAPSFPDDLVRRLREIIEWRRTGVAELPALRAYVDQNLSHASEVDTLRLAEDETLMEAARLIVRSIPYGDQKGGRARDA